MRFALPCCLLLAILPLAGSEIDSEDLENAQKEVRRLQLREAELAEELDRVRRQIAVLVRGIQTQELPRDTTEPPFPIDDLMGREFRIADSTRVHEEPRKDASLLTVLFFSDLVRVNDYEADGWWSITILCEHEDSLGEARKFCDADGFAHQEELGSTLAVEGFVVPEKQEEEAISVSDVLPSSITLEPDARLAAYPGGIPRRPAGSPELGEWQLIGAAKSEGLSELLVERGSVRGWVGSYAVDPSALDALKRYADTLARQYVAFREEMKTRYPEMIVYEAFPVGPNSAGGVDVKVALEVFGSKTVKYFTIELEAYNTVGDRVGGRLRSEPRRRLKLTGPISATDGISQVQWEDVWYNPTISCLKVARIEVEYMDGSSYTYVRELPKILYAHLADGCHDQP